MGTQFFDKDLTRKRERSESAKGKGNGEEQAGRCRAPRPVLPFLVFSRAFASKGSRLRDISRQNAENSMPLLCQLAERDRRQLREAALPVPVGRTAARVLRYL